MIKHEVKNKPSFYCETNGMLVPDKLTDNKISFIRCGYVENTPVNEWMLGNKGMDIKGSVVNDDKQIKFNSTIFEETKLNLDSFDFKYTKKLTQRIIDKFNVNLRVVSISEGFSDKVYVIIKVVNPKEKDKIKESLKKVNIDGYDIYDDLHFLITEK